MTNGLIKSVHLPNVSDGEHDAREFAEVLFSS